MNILIIKPSSLGDVIHGLRVINQVYSSFPKATVDWVIKEELSGILDAYGRINEIFKYRRRSGLLSYINLVKAIRHGNYDYYP